MALKLILMNLYLDYRDNYTSVEIFAQDMNLSVPEANIIITAGKNLTELKQRQNETPEHK